MDRRNFIKVCSASAAAIAAGAQRGLAHAGTVRDFARVKLVDADGKPLKAASLGSKEAYVFNYPYAGTPCFLISLPAAAPGGATLRTEAGEAYTFAGGVGPNRNIVAYLAICTHQFAYPKKAESQISYNAGQSEVAGRTASITCCAHNSAFDPAAGGQVIGGPAKEPLAAIRLEHDAATDELFATGVVGADLIDSFFKKYKARLNAEMGFGKYREATEGSALAVPLSKYSAQADSC
jgi:Rieske Fe-S protein